MWGWFRTRVADHTLLLAVIAGLTLPNLGGPSLWDVDEGVNAEAAREMQEAGTWVIPTFNFELRTAKPVMIYWLQRMSYAAFGVTNEWTARFPSVLAGWLTVLLTYELARRQFGRPTGLLAGIVLASAAEFCALAHAATPDATLLLFTVLTYFVFWVGHENGGRGWWIPTAVACGLAVLTKGPVGVALPGLVVVLYFAWNRELRRLLDWRLGAGLLAGALVAGPWYALVASETRGAWVKDFFLNENVNRALTPMENHRGPIFYHASALLALFAPWSVFIGGVLWYGVKACRRSTPVLDSGNHQEEPFSHKSDAVATAEPLHPLPNGLVDPHPYRFLLCWFSAYLVFFSIVSTKLPNYILPLYPALAILTARFLVRWREGELQMPRWLMQGAIGGMFVIAVVVGVGLLVAGGVIGGLPAKARVFPGVERWAVLGVIPLIGAGLMAWRLRAGSRSGVVTVMAATAVVFVGLLAAFPPGEWDRYKAPRELVRQTGVDNPGRDVRLAGFDWFQPSVVFYARREVVKLSSPDKAAEFLAVPTEGYLFVPEPTWRKWIQDKVAVPYHEAGRHFDFYRNCDVLVIANGAGR